MERSLDPILSAGPLEPGETVRTHCPTCQGPRPTLTVTMQDDGVVVWNCYRASCDERGARGARGAIRRSDKPRAPRFVPYDKPMRTTKAAEDEFLWDRLGLDADHLDRSGVRWAEEDNRYAFPIYRPDRTRRGWLLRSWDPFVRTKALTHMEADEPHLSWYLPVPVDQGACVIVEDIPSALRAARYMNAVALCGTSCGRDYAVEIARTVRQVVWALDADALAKSLKLRREYAPLFDNSGVLPLEQDLKDMKEAALCELLEPYW